jgi:hypothetical protein
VRAGGLGRWISALVGGMAVFAGWGTVSAAGDAAAPVALSTIGTPAAAGRPLDAREVIVPVPGAERMRIDNPLGNVTIRAWGRADAIHIIAEKSSPSPEVLARLRVHFTVWAGGEVSVETRVEMGGRERALPLVASRVDLLVEVPAALEIVAKTFAGDLTASGLRAGARLETTGGRIGISDVHGRVITRQLRGGQTVLAVDGDVDLDGVEGQMRLEGVAGARIEARVVDGDIRAVDIRSNEVRLSTTTGQVVLLGLLRPHAHYDLRSYSGEVRLSLVPTGLPSRSGLAATAFELHVRSPLPIASSIPLRTLWRQGERLWAIATPIATSREGRPAVMAEVGRMTARQGTAGGPGGNPEGRGPVVELSSVLGRVVLTATHGFDDAATAGGEMPGGIRAMSPF